MTASTQTAEAYGFSLPSVTGIGAALSHLVAGASKAAAAVGGGVGAATGHLASGTAAAVTAVSGAPAAGLEAVLVPIAQRVVSGLAAGLATKTLVAKLGADPSTAGVVGGLAGSIVATVIHDAFAGKFTHSATAS